MNPTRRTFLQWTGLGLAAPGVLVEACGGAAAPAGAKPSGTLTVYSALNESTNNAFMDAFKKAYPGVQTSVLGLAAAGELQTRIRT